MVCCMCDAPGGCFCGCGSCGIDEDVLFRQKQREKLLASVKKLKGLSKNSKSHLPLDPVAVVEDARARAYGGPASPCCITKSGVGTWFMLFWLFVHGAALSSLHFKLVDLGQVLPRTAMGVLDHETFSEFHRFFSVGVLAMMGVMSAAFLMAALRICEFVYSMTAEVVGAAQEELRMDVCESIDHDFYAFVRRLRANFVTCEDFTVAAIRKAHRRLHTLLKARIALVDLDVHGPFVVRQEVDSRIKASQCCMLFFVFFIPWLVTMGLNLAQLSVVFDSGAAVSPPPEYIPPQEGAALDLEAALNDQGFAIIAASLLINFFATVYLAFVQSRCVEQWFASCLYPKVHSAVLEYCNRLVFRTWEESVVEELVEYVEEPRTAVDLDTNTDINMNSINMNNLNDVNLSTLYQPVTGSQVNSQSPFQSNRVVRLHTDESCGPCTTHQAALQQAPRAPRSKAQSQCLALEPFTMSPDTESCPGDLIGGIQTHYVELEDHTAPPFDDSKVWIDESESSQHNNNIHLHHHHLETTNGGCHLEEVPEAEGVEPSVAGRSTVSLPFGLQGEAAPVQPPLPRRNKSN